MANVKPVNMKSDTFSQMKTDLDITLNRLLKNMDEYASDKADLTVKITVTLDDGPEGTVPKFDHKITSTLQIKDEAKGTVGGAGYVLEEDGHGGHVLRPTSEQTQMDV